MASRIWSREDIRNILLAIYAAKLLPTGDTAESEDAAAADRFYLWGCRAAIQSIMLAFGLPLQLLDQLLQEPSAARHPEPGTTEHWWLEDVENVVSAVYRSALSAPVPDLSMPHLQCYQHGFGHVVDAFLKAIGSRKNPQRWYQQALSERQWIFPQEGEAPLKWVGSTLAGDTEA